MAEEVDVAGMAEADIRNLLMKALYERFGARDSWRDAGQGASFAIDWPGVSGSCAVEKVLEYRLPDGTRLPHKSDILFDYQRSGPSRMAREYLSIEVKHVSAVTDQFKCRAFDMLHMKQTFGLQLHGILVFARAGVGIGFERARAICYPFDDFIGIDLLKADTSTLWQPVLGKVEAVLGRA